MACCMVVATVRVYLGVRVKGGLLQGGSTGEAGGEEARRQGGVCALVGGCREGGEGKAGLREVRWGRGEGRVGQV